MALVVVLLNIYQRNLKMPKDEEHIIDWILDKTDFRKNRKGFRSKKKASDFERRKHKIDNFIFYCKECGECWARAPKYIDDKKWTKYPKGVIPTLGKKRKTCKECKNRDEDY